MKRKGKEGGRPPHNPTERDRLQVRTLAAVGVTVADVAKVMGLSIPTLRKHYASELSAGSIEANAKVAQSLFKQATDPKKPSTVACIFWLKSRAGWRDRDTVPASPEEEPHLGKKDQANVDARSAAAGTEWADLLPEGVTAFRKQR